MKKCAYCGRENDPEAARCCECGTDEFVTPATASPPAQSRPTLPLLLRVPKWIAWMLLIGGLYFAVALFPVLIACIVYFFHPESWCILSLVVPGYLVYFGWLWRTRQTSPKRKAVWLWSISIAVNLYAIGMMAFGMIQSGDFDLGELFAVSFWWEFVTLISIIALCCEISGQKQFEQKLNRERQV